VRSENHFFLARILSQFEKCGTFHNLKSVEAYTCAELSESNQYLSIAETYFSKCDLVVIAFTVIVVVWSIKMINSINRATKSKSLDTIPKAVKPLIDLLTE
jgi:hypothetical protein